MKPSDFELAEATVQAKRIKMAVGFGVALAALGMGTGGVFTPSAAQEGKQVAKIERPNPPPAPAFDLNKVTGQEVLDLLNKATESLKPSLLADDKPGDDEIERLKKERHRTAVRELRLEFLVLQAGARGTSLDMVLKARRRV